MVRGPMPVALRGGLLLVQRQVASRGIDDVDVPRAAFYEFMRDGADPAPDVDEPDALGVVLRDAFDEEPRGLSRPVLVVRLEVAPGGLLVEDVVVADAAGAGR